MSKILLSSVLLSLLATISFADVISAETTYYNQSVDPYMVVGYPTKGITTYGYATIGTYSSWAHVYGDLLGLGIHQGDATVKYADTDHNNYFDIANGLGIANAFSTVASYNNIANAYQAYQLNATAIGDGSNAGAIVSTSIGAQSAATGVGTTAVGAFAVANYAYGTALGYGAYSQGFDAMAVGSMSRAKGDFSTAIGSYSVTNGEQSIGIGLNTYTSATATQSIAVGSNAAVYGTQSVSIGANSGVYGNNSVAIGAGSVAFGNNEVSVGSVGGERRITNVATPINGTDAANKQYVDDAVANVSGGGNSLAEANAYTDQKIADVKQELRKEMHESTALAIALSTPAVIENGKDNGMSIGVGQYKSAAAIGVSYSRRATRDTFVNFGVSAVGQSVASRASYNLSF